MSSEVQDLPTTTLTPDGPASQAGRPSLHLPPPPADNLNSREEHALLYTLVSRKQVLDETAGKKEDDATPLELAGRGGTQHVMRPARYSLRGPTRGEG